MYHRSDDELRNWMGVPAAEKLRWLEEITEFLETAMPLEAKEFRERLRRGERLE